MHTPDGEPAYRISAQMFQALTELEQCIPAPHRVPNVATAVAMLNRGWITKAQPGEPVAVTTLYYLTPAGSTALRIERRQRKPNATQPATQDVRARIARDT